jgi:DNA polymerase-3 subunit epsilon
MFPEYRITRDKGKSLTYIPKDFVVIDIETTGLDPNFDNIIEIGALKVRDHKIIDEFQSLVKPPKMDIYTEDAAVAKPYYIDDFITNLTGITNEMLEKSPEIENVLPNFIDFVGKEILVGHNIHFDINFLYDASMNLLDHSLDNDFLDLLRVSKKAYPDLPNHKLSTVSQLLGINAITKHRSLADCEITHNCIVATTNYMKSKGITIEDLFHQNRTWPSSIDLTQLKATTDTINPDHLFCNRNVTFTGALEKMSRADAAQLIANLGGNCLNGVTKQTNFLILGNFDYVSSIKNGKSSKLKKAEELILKGHDLSIISENVFYDLL